MNLDERSGRPQAPDTLLKKMRVNDLGRFLQKTR
jgi:hypothetical protein